MKYIQLLADVVLMDLLTGEPYRGPDGRQEPPITMSHKQFLRGRLCDLAFGQSYERGKAQDKIAEALEVAHVYLPVEDADHEVLCETVRSPHPQSPYNPQIRRSLRPFMDAVLEAPSKLPEQWDLDEKAAREAASPPKSDGEEPAASAPN